MTSVSPSLQSVAASVRPASCRDVAARFVPDHDVCKCPEAASHDTGCYTINKGNLDSFSPAKVTVKASPSVVDGDVRAS